MTTVLGDNKNIKMHNQKNHRKKKQQYDCHNYINNGNSIIHNDKQSLTFI